MRKTERELRNWANHLAMQLRRRGTGYSVSRLYSDVPISGLERRIDFRTLSQVEPWLRKWMDDELVRLGSSANDATRLALKVANLSKVRNGCTKLFAESGKPRRGLPFRSNTNAAD